MAEQLRALAAIYLGNRAPADALALADGAGEPALSEILTVLQSRADLPPLAQHGPAPQPAR